MHLLLLHRQQNYCIAGHKHTSHLHAAGEPQFLERPALQSAVGARPRRHTPGARTSGRTPPTTPRQPRSERLGPVMERRLATCAGHATTSSMPDAFWRLTICWSSHADPTLDLRSTRPPSSVTPCCCGCPGTRPFALASASSAALAAATSGASTASSSSSVPW